MAKNTGTIIVGLAGPSGAGKTVFSQKIQNLMPGDPVYLLGILACCFVPATPASLLLKVCVQAVLCCPWTCTMMPPALWTEISMVRLIQGSKSSEQDLASQAAMPGLH